MEPTSLRFARLARSLAEAARAHGVNPLARILAYASHAQEPEWFTTAPVGAVRKVLAALGWNATDVDLYEINEAFSVVSLAATRTPGLEMDKVDVHGGAVALGHPIGASGARILTTPIYAMQRRDAHRGIAAICIGGGEAAGVIIER